MCPHPDHHPRCGMATVSMNVTNGLVPVVMRGSIAALKP
jgi:hypothetical protein